MMDTSRRITRNQRQSRHTRWTKNKACSNTVAHPMDTEKLVRADILQQTCVCVTVEQEQLYTGICAVRHEDTQAQERDQSLQLEHAHMRRSIRWRKSTASSRSRSRSTTRARDRARPKAGAVPTAQGHAENNQHFYNNNTRTMTDY